MDEFYDAWKDKGVPEVSASEIPTDPISALASSALQMHELYVTFIGAGFAPEQSMDLIKAILASVIANQNKE